MTFSQMSRIKTIIQASKILVLTLVLMVLNRINNHLEQVQVVPIHFHLWAIQMHLSIHQLKKFRQYKKRLNFSRIQCLCKETFQIKTKCISSNNNRTNIISFKLKCPNKIKWVEIHLELASNSQVKLKAMVNMVLFNSLTNNMVTVNNN